MPVVYNVQRCDRVLQWGFKKQILRPGHNAEVLSSTTSPEASSSTTRDAISSYHDVNELKNSSPVFP